MSSQSFSPAACTSEKIPLAHKRASEAWRRQPTAFTNPSTRVGFRLKATQSRVFAVVADDVDIGNAFVIGGASSESICFWLSFASTTKLGLGEIHRAALELIFAERAELGAHRALPSGV